MNVRLTLLALTAGPALIGAHQVNAQQHVCGTDQVQQRMLQQNPRLAQEMQEQEISLQEYLAARKSGFAGMRDDVVYTVPVVFHILHNPVHENIGTGVSQVTITTPNNADQENISDDEILLAMNRLNRDYRKLNTDLAGLFNGYGALAADIHIEFRLATKTPQGECTNGINRINTIRSSHAGQYAKLQPWLRARYLNVWVVESIESGAAGYSQVPAMVNEALGAFIDGVMILWDYTAAENGALTHEVGHWLNLAHLWGSNNGEDNASPGNMSAFCGDDGVHDTPWTKGHSPGNCRLNDITCRNHALEGPYDFSNVTQWTGAVDPDPTPKVPQDDFTFPGDTVSMGAIIPFTAVNLAINPSQDGIFSFAGWGLGAADGATPAQFTGDIDLTKYYELVISPTVRYSMDLDSISFVVNRSDNGPRTFSVRVSTASSTNLPGAVLPANPNLAVITSNKFDFINDIATSVSGGRVRLSTTTFPPAFRDQPLRIRFYAWNAESADGYFGIDNVLLHGKLGVVENVQNYMEYAYCTSQMFTEGQKERMRAAIEASLAQRSNLWTAQNHFETGLLENAVSCGPKAGFYPMNPFACVGSAVQFKDNSTNFPTSWAWSFQDGVPATSTERNPTVSFSSGGSKWVTLTVTNANGSNTYTMSKAVEVAPPYGDIVGPFTEGFNSAPMFWTDRNYENNQTNWRFVPNVGHNAPGCMKLNASETYNIGLVAQDMLNSVYQDVDNGVLVTRREYLHDRDDLVSPTLDLRWRSNIQLRFWFSYASTTSTIANVVENLRVSWTNNCGDTWTSNNNTANFTGATIITAGVNPLGHIPAAGDWQEVVINLPNFPSMASNNVRFRFSYETSIQSNDIYIDDVSITANGSTGMDEADRTGWLSLYPNPANEQLTVDLGLGAAEHGVISFVDMTGRTVYNENVKTGQQQLTFDLKSMDLSSGVYIVRLDHAFGQRTERLVVR